LSSAAKAKPRHGVANNPSGIFTIRRDDITVGIKSVISDSGNIWQLSDFNTFFFRGTSEPIGESALRVNVAGNKSVKSMTIFSNPTYNATIIRGCSSSNNICTNASVMI
jgi:hypothetical protein